MRNVPKNFLMVFGMNCDFSAISAPFDLDQSLSIQTFVSVNETMDNDQPNLGDARATRLKRNNSLPSGDHLLKFVFPAGKISVIRSGENFNRISSHSFVLTQSSGSILYGSCVIKYMPISKIESLNMIQDESPFIDQYFYPVAISLLSTKPLYETLRIEIMRLYESLSDEQIDKESLQKAVLSFFISEQQMETSSLTTLSQDSPSSMEQDSPEIDSSLLFTKLEYETIISIFNALLNERSVIFVSDDISLLVPLMEELRMLLYPLKWSFAFLPVVPCEFIDALQIPQPVFAGIHRSYASLLAPNIHDLIVVDVDTNTMSYPPKYQGPLLPRRLSRKLLLGLSDIFGDTRDTTMHADSDILKIRQMFLSVIASFLSGYQNFFIEGIVSLTEITDKTLHQKPLFNFEEFVQSAPPLSSTFLSSLISTQMFQEFVEELHPMNINSIGNYFERFQIEVRKRERKRAAGLNRLLQSNKTGFIWVRKGKFPFDSWKSSFLFLEGRNIFFSRQNVSSEFDFCCGSTTSTLICRLQPFPENTIRVVDPSEIKFKLKTPWAFEVIIGIPCRSRRGSVDIEGFFSSNSDSSIKRYRRKTILFCCVDSEEDLKHWVDMLYSRCYTLNPL